MNRKQLEKRFSLYPDVVTLPEFRQMLGGIGDKTARKLVRENRVKHYYIRNTYLIPKTHVIDYLLSTHYDLFMDIVRVLAIDSELICHPEKAAISSELEDMLRMLCNCDPRSLKSIKATAKALIDTTSEK